MVLILFSSGAYSQQPSTKMSEIGYCLAYYSFWNNITAILQNQSNIFEGKIPELEIVYLKNYTFDDAEFKKSFREKSADLLLEVKTQDRVSHTRDYLFCQQLIHSE